MQSAKDSPAQAVDIAHANAPGPHEAAAEASSAQSIPCNKEKSWQDHNKIFAIPFVLCPEGHGHSCCEHCCEQPFGDSQIAKDIHVVYARWDNYRKQFVPICRRDHVFEDPPIMSSISWEIIGTCCLAVVVVGIILASSLMEPYARKTSDTTSDIAIALACIGLFVAVVGCITLGGCFRWK